MLKNYRKFLDDKLVELNVYDKNGKVLRNEIVLLEDDLDTLKKCREIFQKSALVTQNHLAEHLSKIVTKALKLVFYEKDVSFKMNFVERRNTTECDMFIMEDGWEYGILDSRGFGMADIASFALRIAYVILHRSENVLILDEPFRHLSEDKHELASMMVKALSKELKIQFIIATHVEALKHHADKHFNMVLENKRTVIK
jgi:DNA repair exonuclease SbcCD ATPase subunit